MLDLAGGYDALRHSVAAIRLSRDALRVAGPDAEAYLQGQLSQDIAAIAPGASAWSLILQPQGKVDALVRVSRTRADEFVIDVDGGYGTAVASRLRRFKLRVKAEIEELGWQCVALRGPQTDVPEAEDLVADATWPGLVGFDLLGPAPTIPSGLPEAPIEAWEVARIEAGVPRLGAELTERTIPAEAGIVDRTVSFTKGCYTGQELVARIDSRGGHVPRRLLGLSSDRRPEPGEAILLAGRDVGLVTSAASHPAGHAVALAYVRRDVEAPAEAELAGGGMVRIQVLPLVS